MTQHGPSWITVSESALRGNLSFFQTRAGNTDVYPVVKSNAYGHGMNLTARILEDMADGFCVHAVDEALRLETGKPVLVLGHVPDDVETLSRVMTMHDVRLTISDPGQLPALESAARNSGRKPRLYIKLETGTHRLGLPPEEARQLVDRIRRSADLQLAGISTHFANIEDTTDHSFARKQLNALLAFRNEIDDHGSLELHAACSAAALLFDNTHLDLIRLGISLYGYYSSRETLVSYRQIEPEPGNGLKPVLAWQTRPIQIKSVNAGEYVGYGLTYRAPRDMRIAVLPVGYADGYDRSIAPAGHVLVHGQRAPIRGRICMNMFMVEISDIPNVNRRDVFTLIGRDGDETITAETIAGWASTIHYEVLARISPDIPRLPVP